jgi:hypothetical protein
VASIHVRGEGGQVIKMDLPLPESIQDRLTKGLIRRVNADGSPYNGAAAEPGPEPDVHVTGSAAASSALTEGRTPRPAATARKAEWVGWAVGVHGMDPEDADAMKKQDLMDLPELPTQPVVPELPSEQTPDTTPGGADGRPAEDADKSEWIAYVVRRGLLSAEDAANYTRDDLIDLAS